ncbi:hypothetical protein DL93DRAFT_2072527 [Clavulina sp. PMI_390]|nr:hypothetical protein DL93DRAFT_2072527 [Clavulina sp. PMI_390]
MQPSRFSADLIYKAALQGEFAVISSGRGMYRPSILQGETKEFEDAIRAYRLFVKLTLLPHLPKVYPTYAVDLVWHTHQLQGRNYKSVLVYSRRSGGSYIPINKINRAQTQDLVGIFLDHRSVDQITPTACKSQIMLELTPT